MAEQVDSNVGRIKPFDGNRSYWEYEGEGVLLLGGSVEDNLFQIANIVEELDKIADAGGNYVRCTMSSRDKGDVWPFAFDEGSGLYDLERWSEEYWRRFEGFLELTAARKIIVQIELWATFDFYRGPWEENSFNPKNNCNYTAEESGLSEVVDSHPTKTENDFFRSVPGELDNELVLRYQRKFIDELLSHSLKFNHVLYCMDNETSVTRRWGAYWSEYVKAAAKERGVSVETTEMWDPHDLSHAMHSYTFDHPETYSFVDISQNNHQKGQKHYDNAVVQLRRIEDGGNVRPANNVKIYGADIERFGSDVDGQSRFWRNVFVGCASARFHRPPHGLGSSEKACAHIRSMRMLTDEMDVFSCCAANDLLSDRSDDEAYCMAKVGVEYAVYFGNGGSVVLDVSGAEGEALSVWWLDVLKSEWGEKEKGEVVDGGLRLTTPGDGYWAVLVK